MLSVSIMLSSIRLKKLNKLDECQFHRFECPLYAPDLAPYDFFLFGDLHNQMEFL
jgi:hypothetical protein